MAVGTHTLGIPLLTVSQAGRVLKQIQSGKWPTNAGGVLALLIMSESNRPKVSKKRKPRRRFRGLMQLKDKTLDVRTELRVFYLIGRAMLDGCASLSAVSREFVQRDLRGNFPENAGVSVASLCTLIRNLEMKLFEFYFKRSNVWLLMHAGPNNPAKVFSDDGWEAWELTRDFLMEYDRLPRWTKFK